MSVRSNGRAGTPAPRRPIAPGRAAGQRVIVEKHRRSHGRRRMTAASVFQRLVDRWGPPETHRDQPVGNFAPPWAVNGRAAAAGGRNIDARLNRNLDAECGYEPNPDYVYYRTMYDRLGPAARAVNIWPDECWGAYPELYETSRRGATPFEKAWTAMNERFNVWHYCHRVDRLSGIYTHGALMLGLDGGADLAAPAVTYNADLTPRKNSQAKNLVYLRAFDADQAKVIEFDRNPASPRHGMPVLYELGGSPSVPDPVPTAGGVRPLDAVRVHWTRVIHVADNREASEAFSVPRLRPVLNVLYDIRKVLGASAEMFWKGGFPGYQFETYPDTMNLLDIDEDDIRDEVAAYVAGLQRYLTAVGGKWSSLAPQVADPSKHLDKLFMVLCSTLGVPMRILFGTESGQLASTQDAGTWKERLHGRQKNYLEPMLVRPLIGRLMDVGALPRVPKYTIEWRDLRSLGDKDRADVFLKQMQAMNMYSTGQVSTYVPLRYALTMLAGFTDEAASAIIDAVGENPKPAAVAAPAPGTVRPAASRPQGGARRGAAAGKRPARTAATAA
jgi:hypothetical protein